MEARDSLSGQQWPKETGKNLEVDFIAEAECLRMIEEETKAEKEGKHLQLEVTNGKPDLVTSTGKKVLPHGIYNFSGRWRLLIEVL
jgi:hypothetical protein